MPATALPCPHVLVRLLAIALLGMGTGAAALAAQDTSSRTPPLIEAIEAADLAAVDSLLASGVDLAAPDSAGWRPLHHAAARDASHMVKRLIDAGAEVDVQNEGWTPLHLAATNNRLGAAVLLRDAGADPEIPDGEGQTPPQAAEARGNADLAAVIRSVSDEARLTVAAALTDTAAVRLLLEAGADPDGQSGFPAPLATAARAGHMGLAALLLDAGAEPEGREAGGWTPLHYAARDDHAWLVRQLLARGATADSRHDGGWTPLMLAAWNNRLPLTVLLLDAGADPTAVNDDGASAMDMARERGLSHVGRLLQGVTDGDRLATAAMLSDSVRLRELLDAGADPDGADAFAAPLALAGRSGDATGVDLLLEAGAHPDGRYVDWTALHYAARDDRADLALRLVEAGADVNATKDDGWTALHLAAWNGNWAPAAILVAGGADTGLLDDEGRTPAASAETRGHTVTAAFLAAPDPARVVFVYGRLGRWDRVLDILLRDQPMAADSAAVGTALRMALQSHPEALPVLLEAGVDPGADLGDGWTALHVAVRDSLSDAVEVLLQHGAEVNAQRRSGRTALMEAALSQSLETALKLWEAGADPAIVDTLDRTPADLARLRSRSGMALLLETLTLDVDTEVVETASAAGAERLSGNPSENATDPQAVLDLRASFYEAVRSGRHRLVTALADLGMDVNELMRDEEEAEVLQQTALHVAASECHDDVIDALIGAGANPFSRDGDDNSALRLSARNDCDILWDFDAFLQGTVDVDLRDDAGYTDFLWAASRSDERLALALLDHGANPHHQAPDGWTALHYAAREGMHGLFFRILAADPALDVQTGEGWTPLMLAATNDRFWMAMTLLESGADPALLDAEGLGAADHAAQAGLGVLEDAIREPGPAHFLAAAAATNRWEHVRKLLAEGTPVGAALPGGWTALHYAAREGADRAVEELLLAGADPDGVTENGWSPLTLAARNGRYGPAVILLGFGADPALAPNDGDTALELARAHEHDAVATLLETPFADFHVAEYAAKGWSESLARVLAEGASPNAPTPWGLRPMAFAVGGRHLDAARVLLEAGADPHVRSADPDDRSLIGAALRAPEVVSPRLTRHTVHEEMVRLLVTHGADMAPPSQSTDIRADTVAQRVLAELGLPEELRDPDGGRRPPVDAPWILLSEEASLVLEAIEAGPDTLAAIVAAGTGTGDRRRGDETLLHLALLNGRPRTARVLLLDGADPSAPGGGGATPLHRAASRGYADVVLALLEAGADPEAVDEAGDTPLHVAARAGRLVASILLVEHGASAERVDRNQQTAAEIADAAGFADVADAIADPDANRALAAALEEGHQHTADWLRDARAAVLVSGPVTTEAETSSDLILAVQSGDIRLVRSLLNDGADPDEADGEGGTALWRAIESHRPDLAEVLIESGADVQRPGPGGRTPLNEALYQGIPATALRLLEAGADPTRADDTGYAPLHRAGTDGPHVGGWESPGVRLVVLDRLLSTGADVDAVTRSGRTPLAVAAQEGSEFAAAMLVCAGADVSLSGEAGVTAVDRATAAGFDRLATWLETPSCPDGLPRGLRRYAEAQHHLLQGALRPALTAATDAREAFTMSLPPGHAFSRAAASLYAEIAWDLGLDEESEEALDEIAEWEELAPEDLHAIEIRAQRLVRAGMYGPALSWLRLGLTLSESLDGRVSALALARARAHMLVSVASTLYAGGDRNLAEDVLSTAVDEVPSNMGYAIFRRLLRLRAAMLEESDPPASRETYQALLSQEREAHPIEHPHITEILAGLGRTYRAEGETDVAASLLVTSLRRTAAVYGAGHPHLAPIMSSLATLIPDPSSPATVRFDEARVAQALLNRADDIEEADVSVAHPTTIGYAIARALTSGHLIRALEELGATNDDWDADLTALVAENERMVGWLNAQRAAMGLSIFVGTSLRQLSVASQQAFLDRYFPPTRDAVFSLWSGELDLDGPYEGLFGLKGRLVHGIREQSVLARSAGDSPEAVELMELRAQIANWSQVSEGVDPEQRAFLLTQLTLRKEELEAELVEEVGTLDDPLGTLDGFRGTLPGGSAFVDVYEYVDGVELRYAAVITAPDSPSQMVKLGAAADLHGLVDEWRGEVVAGAPAAEAWARLAEALWRGISGSLPPQTRHIWVSPDGVLARVPWHLLPGVTGPSVAQIGSARELMLLLDRRGAQRVAPAVDLAVAGGIDFDAGVAPGSSTRRFAPLPGTAAEAEAIAEVAGAQGLAVARIGGADATRERVVETITGARVIHLATHGFFQRSTQRGAGSRSQEVGAVVDPATVPPSRNPLVETGLALAGANGSGGTLTAEELIGLDLSATDLVVLSACETGRGTEVSGQGVMGLPASLAAAGAGSVLMSLWKVPDESTALLMTEFYRGWLAGGLSPGEALSRAQEVVRSDPRFTAPVHWAAWVLVGDAFGG